MRPRLLEVCAGIGAISLAAQWAGFEIAGFVEIESFRAIYLYHAPVASDGYRKEVAG